MIPRFLSYATFGGALGCGLIAGVFFAFSSFVMPALARLPASQGIAAMQSINVTVINPIFMGVLFGTGVLSLGLATSALRGWSDPGAPFRFAGGAVYVVGTILVTMAWHVPRNEALALLDADTAAAARSWSTYLSEWTVGNHVRGVAALLGAALLTVALVKSQARGE